MANVAPLAPTLAGPGNNGYVIFDEANLFSWVHNDPGDPQASASLRYKPAGGAWTTLANVAAGLGQCSIPSGAFADGTVYEWQVQTKDSGGLWSPWSASWFFTAAGSPVPPVIVSPAPGATVVASPLLVSWTIPAGWPVDGWRLFVGGAALQGDIYSSGHVDSAATAVSVLVDLPAGAGATQHISVSAYMGGTVTEWAERSFTNAMLPVERALIVLTQVPGKPQARVSITNPAPSAGHVAAVKNDVFRDGVRVLKDRLLNDNFVSTTPGAGLVEYVVRAYAANGTFTDSY